MTTMHCIPPSVLHWLATVPTDAPVAMLLRHSVRGPLPENQVGDHVPLTDDGVALARELGKVLGSRLKSLQTSPVLRCVQTAEGLRTGADSSLELKTSDLLGDPGIYVVDPARAWQNWLEVGHEAVVTHLATRDQPLPGTAQPPEAARQLVQRMPSWWRSVARRGASVLRAMASA